jgi:NADP-dependent 3-hydroxy acid dehydrogenase YdfG
MFEVNVIGLMQVTKALVPALVASGAGVILNVGSTAGRVAYEGGGGYTAAKHGTKVVSETLRLELFDQPVRVCEIAHGMVKTDEFAKVRFAGDEAKAEAVYERVAEPLTADDVADAITWMVTRPAHVNIDELVIRPRAQAAQHKVHRVRDDH